MNKTCIQLADIDEAVNCSELDNLAGVVTSLIYFYWNDVATWPAMPAPATEDGSMTF